MKLRALTMAVAAVLLLGQVAAAAPVEITWWAPNWTEAAAKAIVAEFNATHSDVQVRVEYFAWSGMQEKYQTVLRAGSGPDVLNVAIDWTRPFAAAGYLLDLTSAARTDLELSDFYPGALATATYDGKVYGLPYRTEPLGMFYNVDFLEAAGFSAERPPQTWDEYEQFAARSFESGRMYPVGLPGSGQDILVSRLAPFIYGNGGAILNDAFTEAVIDSPAAVEAIDYYVTLSKSYGPPGAVSLTNDDLARLFQGGVLGSMVNQPAYVDNLKNSNVRYVTAQIPAGAAGTSSVLKGWNVVIPAATEHPDEAWEFVQFFVRPENMAKYTATFPGRKAATAASRFQAPELSVFLQSLEAAVANPGIPEWPTIEHITWSEIQKVYLGQATAEQAAGAVASQVNDLLND